MELGATDKKDRGGRRVDENPTRSISLSTTTREWGGGRAETWANTKKKDEPQGNEKSVHLWKQKKWNQQKKNEKRMKNGRRPRREMQLGKERKKRKTKKEERKEEEKETEKEIKKEYEEKPNSSNEQKATLN